MLFVHDFGVEYVVRKHAEHLDSVLKKYYEISEDWEGAKFVDIELNWDYKKRHSVRTFILLMKNYITKLLLKVGHQPSFKK